MSADNENKIKFRQYEQLPMSTNPLVEGLLPTMRLMDWSRNMSPEDWESVASLCDRDLRAWEYGVNHMPDEASVEANL